MEKEIQKVENVAPITIFSNRDNFELGQRMAQVFASSDIVPKTFQGKIGNCMIGIEIANRIGVNVLQVLQNLYVVHGVPSFSATFAISCFNATGKYSPIRYKEVGEKGKDSWGYIAYAIEKASGDICEGPEVTIATAKAEGWYNQNPKWKNIPDLMLRYRAASWFIRTTDPGVMMGFQTREEVEDITDNDYVEITSDADNVAEAEENANTEQIVIPAAEEHAEEVKAEPEKKEQPKPVEEKPKQAKPMGATETPELFK